jgi:hypothetical protein
MRPVFVVCLALAALCAASPARSQQHPITPTTAQPPPAVPRDDEELTADELADAIESYIEDDAVLKGGYFMVYDAAEKKALALTLDKVHRDRAAKTGNGIYFGCAEMKSTDGTAYDIDIFMVEDEEEVLEPTEISIHEKAGKPRYTWKEEGGISKKVAP